MNEKSKLEELEQLLKYHDWYYDYSDCFTSWTRGSESLKKIKELVDELGDDGKKLFNKYSK